MERPINFTCQRCGKDYHAIPWELENGEIVCSDCAGGDIHLILAEMRKEKAKMEVLSFFGWLKRIFA